MQCHISGFQYTQKYFTNNGQLFQSHGPKTTLFNNRRLKDNFVANQSFCKEIESLVLSA